MPTTIKEIERFLRFLSTEKQYSHHTIKNYQRDLYKFANHFNLQKYTLNDVKQQHCQQYIYQLEQEKYSRKSIARHLSTLRSFWSYVSSKNKEVSNPWQIMSSPRIKKQFPQILSHKDIHTFLNTLETKTPIDIRNKSICELLYSSGIRVSELCNISLEHINWQEKEIHIIGKGNKERSVLFGETTKKFLRNYIQNVRTKWAKNKQDKVFLNTYGSALSTRSVQRIIKTAAKKQNLQQHITPHTFRHCFATNLYEGGADLSIVQHLLGHENINSTQIYTHLSVKHLKKVFNNAHPRASLKKNKEKS
ncbi:MAG: site-specific tyrosine recombinase/integron integrase [bacterium]